MAYDTTSGTIYAAMDGTAIIANSSSPSGPRSAIVAGSSVSGTWSGAPAATRFTAIQALWVGYGRLWVIDNQTLRYSTIDQWGNLGIFWTLTGQIRYAANPTELSTGDRTTFAPSGHSFAAFNSTAFLLVERGFRCVRAVDITTGYASIVLGAACSSSTVPVYDTNTSALVPVAMAGSSADVADLAWSPHWSLPRLRFVAYEAQTGAVFLASNEGAIIGLSFNASLPAGGSVRVFLRIPATGNTRGLAASRPAPLTQPSARRSEDAALAEDLTTYVGWVNETHPCVIHWLALTGGNPPTSARLTELAPPTSDIRDAPACTAIAAGWEPTIPFGTVDLFPSSTRPDEFHILVKRSDQTHPLVIAELEPEACSEAAGSTPTTWPPTSTPPTNGSAPNGRDGLLPAVTGETGLSTGVLAAIIAGGAVAVIVIIVVLLLIVRTRLRGSSNGDAESQNNKGDSASHVATEPVHAGYTGREPFHPDPELRSNPANSTGDEVEMRQRAASHGIDGATPATQTASPRGNINVSALDFASLCQTSNVLKETLGSGSAASTVLSALASTWAVDPSPDCTGGALAATRPGLRRLERLHERRRELLRQGPGAWSKLMMVGRGSMGAVWAVVLRDGSTVAMKELPLNGAEGDVARQAAAVEREVAVLKAVNHPHVVAYYGAEEAPHEFVVRIFMEHVSGGSLGALVRAMPERLSPATARAFAFQITLGLAYLHARGIVHRDLKCDNLLIDDHGTVKLADFGTARVIGTAGGASGAATTLVGTPLYMAPEVLTCTDGGGAGDDVGYGTAADVWSLGITVAELCDRGQTPWPSFASAGHAFMYIGGAQGVPTLPAHLDAGCRAFVERCCQRDPRARPSARELLEDPWIAGVLPRDAYVI